MSCSVLLCAGSWQHKGWYVPGTWYSTWYKYEKTTMIRHCFFSLAVDTDVHHWHNRAGFYFSIDRVLNGHVSFGFAKSPTRRFFRFRFIRRVLKRHTSFVCENKNQSGWVGGGWLRVIVIVDIFSPCFLQFIRAIFRSSIFSWFLSKCVKFNELIFFASGEFPE